jgi:hypothetical protein
LSLHGIWMSTAANQCSQEILVLDSCKVSCYLRYKPSKQFTLENILQTSHWLKTLCELESLNMGGPSSNPIRCVKKDSERKGPTRGVGPEGRAKEKNPSRVSVILV